MSDKSSRLALLQKVQHACSETIGLSPAEVLADYDLREDLGMSPVEIGEVLMRLQEEYQVELTKEELKTIVEELTTVDSLVTYVEDELEL
ncbi:MAG TPA: phosphopantetheine-binding protein [Candidatus Saccharimonadia bacterium]|nr:phosphopantetheine-binding protein [Candidatus Saccharimonadia bacterium]